MSFSNIFMIQNYIKTSQKYESLRIKFFLSFFSLLRIIQSLQNREFKTDGNHNRDFFSLKSPKILQITCNYLPSSQTKILPFEHTPVVPKLINSKKDEQNLLNVLIL